MSGERMIASPRKVGSKTGVLRGRPNDAKSSREAPDSVYSMNASPDAPTTL